MEKSNLELLLFESDILTFNSFFSELQKSTIQKFSKRPSESKEKLGILHASEKVIRLVEKSKLELLLFESNVLTFDLSFSKLGTKEHDSNIFKEAIRIKKEIGHSRNHKKMIQELSKKPGTKEKSDILNVSEKVIRLVEKLNS